MRKNDESGFSLVELMVAMVVTLIITGAIFGLLSGGQSAFKVQPERTDQQQNMRVAMDLIMRDIASAGVGMPDWMQTFTPALDTTGPFNGPAGLTDQLEMLVNNTGFENQPVCATPGNANSANIWLYRGTPAIAAGTPIMVFFADGTWTMRYAIDNTSCPNGNPDNCTGGSHCKISVNQGAGDPTGMNTPGGVCKPSGTGVGNAGDPNNVIPPDPACGNTDPCCTVTSVGLGGIVRYRINAGADGVPNLERSENGGAFQSLARGIEDLQVEYQTSGGAITANAPVVVANTYPSLITQVRVTLSARGTVGNFQGATGTGGTNPTAIRGTLTSQSSPRQALWTLTKDVAPTWN